MQLHLIYHENCSKEELDLIVRFLKWQKIQFKDPIQDNSVVLKTTGKLIALFGEDGHLKATDFFGAIYFIQNSRGFLS